MLSRSTGAVLLAAFLVGSGCATLFASKSTTVSFNSNPVGASILVDGNRVGSTPFSMELDHKKDHVITFRMQGREDMTCLIGRKIGVGWIILDVLGGLVPVIIDAATGSWHSLDKNQCSVTLPSSGDR